MIDLAQNLLKIRKELGLNQTEMAKKFGIAQRTWSSYETGRSDPPMSILFKLAEEGFQIEGLTTGAANKVLNDVSRTTGLSKDEIVHQRLEQLKDLPSDTPISELPKAKYITADDITAKRNANAKAAIAMLETAIKTMEAAVKLLRENVEE